MTVEATENYPIYAYKQQDFVKIYEPKAIKNDAGYSTKHHFLGTKPERHIYGWKRLFDKYDAKCNDLRKQISKTKSPITKARLEDELANFKIDSVVICTGGSDGLNIASLGYDVIWFNSEAELLSSDEYHELSKIVKVIYYCPDLDTTGVKQAVALGMKFLQIKIIWLPDFLKKENKKDAADWVRKHKSLSIDVVCGMFKKIVSQALEFQFWEWNKKKGVYSLNNKIMLYFLKHSGFYLNKITLKSADSHSEIEKTRIVHIKDNIVRTVSPRQVKSYVLKWIDDNFINIKIYNMILKSIYFSENALLQLEEITIDTKTATANSQLYFFNNKVVKITDKKIEDLAYSSVQNLVWHSDIIDHRFELTKPLFEISKDDADNWRINLHSKESNFLKVLINTSRMFWEKDADPNQIDLNPFSINSKNLAGEENLMQELQLINKIYTVGYILHKYKIKQKAYFTLGVDHKNGISTKESNGRSGKSFIQDALRCFLKNWKDKNGKLLPKENQQFIYDKVTASTDYILFDDLHEYQDYNFFFAVVTGSLEANHKGGEIYDIPFDESPKIGGTTNFAPLNLSPSLQGRLLVYYTSDYYHQKTEDNGYAFTRQISDDFNKQTILDKNYSEKDWNNDYNFMLQCLQFYLSCNEKIDAPMEGLIIKNLRQIIGDAMLKFCAEIFAETTYLNCWVNKKELYDDYKNEIGGKAKSSQRFKEDLIHYCKTKKWSIEFKKLPTNNETTGKRIVVENFYIKTTENAALNNNALYEQQETPNDDKEDLPF